MRFYTTLVALAPLVLTVRAGIDFDLDDAPSVCRDTCRPISDLASRCSVDLRGDDNDRQEDQLEAQCFCTNESFDVGARAALCQDCIRQNYNSTDHDHDDDDDDDDDDHDHDEYDDVWEDIVDIVRTCSFSSTSWNPSATSVATSISVSADRPTDAAQLTTTYSVAPNTSGGNSPIQTNPPSNDNNNNDDNSSSNSNNNNDDDNNDDGGAAAGIAAPVYLAGAVVAGAIALFV